MNMGWSIGYDNNWNRDIGYGVPAYCDSPKCVAEIDRGLAFVCGSDVRGGDFGCGLYFCEKHLTYRKPRYSDKLIQLCPRCYQYRPSYKPRVDHPDWIKHKMTDPSWEKWRKSNPIN